MRGLSRRFFLACVVCLGAAAFGADRNPGLVTRITQKGVDYAADKVVRELEEFAKEGIPLGDQNVSYNGYIGGAQLSFSDMVVTRLEGVRLGVKIDEDVGLKVSLRIAQMHFRGSLHYGYSVLWIPVGSNRFAFNATLSDIALNFTAILDVDLNAQAAMTAIRCDALVHSVKLNFESKETWATKLGVNSESSKITRRVSETVCTKLENTRFVLINDTNRYLRMCILGTCTLMLVLPLVAQPVFGKGYVEMAHAVEIRGQDGARIVPPFVPRPFRRLPEHGRMLTVYLSPYAANSMLYALYRSGKLVFKIADKDLLQSLQDNGDSCMSGLCLARFLARQFLNSRLEVAFTATSCPRIEVSANITKLTIQSDLTIKSTRDNSVTSTLARVPINVVITGRAHIDKNKLSFNITDDEAKQTGGQGPISVIKGGIGQLLVKIFETKMLSKFRELGKVGILLPEYADIRWKNPSLITVDDTYVMTTDVVYSPNP